MEKLWSSIGIPFLDFIQISVLFLLTMLVFFGSKGTRNRWLNNLFLIIFTVQCGLVVALRPGVNVKAFALLMLVSVFVIEGLTLFRRTSQQHNR